MKLKSIIESFTTEHDDHSKKIDGNQKTEILKLISEYNRYGHDIERHGNLGDIKNKILAICENVPNLVNSENGEKINPITIKNDMVKLSKLAKDFDKIIQESHSLDQRLHASYDDIGILLNRYFEISDIKLTNENENLQ